MNKPKTLYIVGAVNLPDLDAGSFRILQLSKVFKQFFDQIIIAGRGVLKQHSLNGYDEKISLIPYHQLGFNGFSDKYQTLFHPDKFFLHDLENIYLKYDVTHIMVYSALPKSSIKALRKFANAHNIKLFFDVVEFQSLRNQTFGSFASFYLPNNFVNKKAIRKGDFVIAISSYLENYFKSKKCNVVRIPFAIDTSSIKTEPINNSEFLSLIYAGNPRGRKDLLSNILKGLSLLSDSEKSKVKFRVFGINSENIIKNKYISKKVFNQTKTIVEYYGQTSRGEISKFYSESDFSVLIRNPKSRTSRAGFPTKVSESLANGVPVICNLSSDLNFYLNNNNSIVMDDFSSKEFAKTISTVLKLSKEEINQMKVQARKTSEKYLDVFLYSNEIAKIVG